MIALTGGIGTGKSTVARMFAALGAVVIDADAIVHELQAPGSESLAEIAGAFGADMLRPDGSLDRERLGDRVFRDAAARARLNAIMHPRVGAEMARRLAAARERGAPLVLLDIPLLLEGRARRPEEHGTAARRAGDGVEAVVVVYAPEALQVERQVARDGSRPEEAARRVASQLPIEEKRRLADHVIDNSGTLEETERQVRALFEELTGRRPEPPPARP